MSEFILCQIYLTDGIDCVILAGSFGKISVKIVILVWMIQLGVFWIWHIPWGEDMLAANDLFKYDIHQKQQAFALTANPHMISYTFIPSWKVPTPTVMIYLAITSFSIM